jgi:acyl-homoserine lactone acylase PvdQ
VNSPPSEAARLRATAERVTITRDDWGIAHINGRTDADAVFGMIYAQAEDDFNRIETNYLVQLGRLAEAEGRKRSGRICACACSTMRPISRRGTRRARFGSSG